MSTMHINNIVTYSVMWHPRIYYTDDTDDVMLCIAPYKTLQVFQATHIQASFPLQSWPTGIALGANMCLSNVARVTVSR